MTLPHYAYYVLAEQRSADELRQLLLELGLERAWTRVVPVRPCFQGQALLQLEITDLETGLPIFAEELGPALAAEDRIALIVGADEEEVAFSLFADGETTLMWGGPAEDFEAEDEDGKVYSGAAGLRELFAQLVGEPWEAFFSAEQTAPDARNVADAGTTLALRGRTVAIPEGFARNAQAFYFHESDDYLPANDDEALETSDDAWEGDERVALVLLHPELLEAFWQELPAAAIVAFFEALAPERERVLGPLAGSFDEALDFFASLPADKPAAQCPTPDLLAFEVLAMGTSLGYGLASSVADFDERFLPLYALGGASQPEVNTKAIEDQLAEINELGALAALTEALPYRVPEGQLLECIDDSHLGPLAPWAQEPDGSYAGSLFLLQPQALASLRAGFSKERLRGLETALLRTWHRLVQPMLAFDDWRQQRPHDQDDWRHFEAQDHELSELMRLGAANELALALVFYEG